MKKHLLFLILCFLFGSINFGYSQSVAPNDSVTGIYSNSPVQEGKNLVLIAYLGTNFYWTGPDNFTSYEKCVIIDNVDTNAAGTYCLTMPGERG